MGWVIGFASITQSPGGRSTADGRADGRGSAGACAPRHSGLPGGLVLEPATGTPAPQREGPDGPGTRRGDDDVRRRDRPAPDERPAEPRGAPAGRAAAHDGLVPRLPPAAERDGGRTRAARLRHVPPLSRAEPGVPRTRTLERTKPGVPVTRPPRSDERTVPDVPGTRHPRPDERTVPDVSVTRHPRPGERTASGLPLCRRPRADGPKAPAMP